jgi:hypothetical protein
MLVLALFCIYTILVTVSGSVLDIPSTKLNKPNQSSKDVNNKQRDNIIDKSPAKSRQEKEQLFEAYNLLHTLAQVCFLSINIYHIQVI